MQKCRRFLHHFYTALNYNLLRVYSLLSHLDQVGRDDAPCLQQVYEWPGAVGHREQHSLQAVQVQGIDGQAVVVRPRGPLLILLGEAAGDTGQLVLAGLTQGPQERSQRHHVQVVGRLLKQPAE